MSDVFISYSRTDDRYVKSLAHLLRSSNLSVWFDEGIPGGAVWFQTIVSEIRQCRILLVILSSASSSSQFVNLECGMAFSLDKRIIPISIDPAVPFPKYLSHLQVISDEGAISQLNLISLIKKELESNFFWEIQFNRGLEIGIRLKGRDDSEFVSVGTLSTALEVQLKLIRDYDAFIHNSDAIRVVPVRDSGVELNPERNWLLLGGPGGFPFVAKLLARWVKSSTLLFGYRFITAPSYFDNGLHIRDSTDGELGIEYLSNGHVQEFFRVVEPKHKVTGISHGIIYTKGFADQSSDNKVIIVAPFSRTVLDGMILFLMDETRRNRWLNEVVKCGVYSQTLLHLRYGLGASPYCENYEPPLSLDD